MTRNQGLAGVGRILDAAEAGSPAEAIEVVTRELGDHLDATAVSFLIADLSGRALVRLAHVPRPPAGDDSHLDGHERRDAEESAFVIPFDGGPAEQAMRTQTVQVLPPGRHSQEEWTVLAPVTQRGEAIGLLEVGQDSEPDSETVSVIDRFAHLLAFIVIANRQHTDLFEWGQRTRPFTLSAEIQQRLLPGSRTCEASAFTFSGWLEPAASIGGDTFDYSLGRDVLHLSLTDAMGHGVNAALTATVCTGSLRGTRRRGMGLQEQAASANEAILEHASGRGTEDYVTGLLGRLDLRNGVLELVNAGHGAPYLLRDGNLSTAAFPPDLPLGMFPDSHYASTTVPLEPGDRLFLMTDGMLERGAEALDLAAEIRRTHALHPREAVRALADGVLEAVGHALGDDATVLCLDWHGRHDLDRDAKSGADRERASDALR